jgi:hypothetical protein
MGLFSRYRCDQASAKFLPRHAGRAGRIFRWRIALEVTNNAASMFSQASDAYRYMSLSGYLFIPLR